MDIYEFQKLTEEIPDFLNENEKEEKVIQLVDLKHFIECYDSDMKIIECIKKQMNIVENNDNKIGIIFFDVKINCQNHLFFETLHYEVAYSQQSGCKELWFVFVEENIAADFRQYVDYIGHYPIKCVS